MPGEQSQTGSGSGLIPATDKVTWKSLNADLCESAMFMLCRLIPLVCLMLFLVSQRSLIFSLTTFGLSDFQQIEAFNFKTDSTGLSEVKPDVFRDAQRSLA